MWLFGDYKIRCTSYNMSDADVHTYKKTAGIIHSNT